MFRKLFFNLYMNYMAEFDWMKLLRLKQYLLCTLSRSRLVQPRHHSLLQYFEVKQIEAVFRRPEDLQRY